MSIEWLLTKTSNNNTQNKASKGASEESELSEKIHSSKSKELNQEKKNCKRMRQPGDKHSLSVKMQNQHSEIELSCDCGFEGKVNLGKIDSKLPEEDRKHSVCFECPNCKLHLQYDCSTGKIKTKKKFGEFCLGSSVSLAQIMKFLLYL